MTLACFHRYTMLEGLWQCMIWKLCLSDHYLICTFGNLPNQFSTRTLQVIVMCRYTCKYFFVWQSNVPCIRIHEWNELKKGGNAILLKQHNHLLDTHLRNRWGFHNRKCSGCRLIRMSVIFAMCISCSENFVLLYYMFSLIKTGTIYKLVSNVTATQRLKIKEKFKGQYTVFNGRQM